MPIFVFSSQQSYQCKESFSIFEETEETVIYNAHLVNQVHIKPLELFEVFILVPGFNVSFYWFIFHFIRKKLLWSQITWN